MQVSPLSLTENRLKLIKNSNLYQKDSIFTLKSVSNPRTCTTVDFEDECRSDSSLMDEILKLLKTLQVPAIVAIVLVFLLTCNPHPALSASGGRMGGSSFSSSSSRSSSRSSSSRSSSSGSRSSYSSSKSKPSYYSTSPMTSSSATSPSNSNTSSSSSASESVSSIVLVGNLPTVLLHCCAFSVFIVITAISLAPKTSIIKLQVCLLGTARLLQKDLDGVAEVADTSTSKGWSYILKESALALLRYPEYCISAHSIVYLEDKNTECMKNIETLFNRLSIKERKKFDEETLINVNNIKRKGTMRKPKSDISNEYIVVTILVAAHGEYKFPPVIKTRENLKEALQILGSIPTEETLAVEVLWTPQDENDALSELELHEKYPLLIKLPQ